MREGSDALCARAGRLAKHKAAVSVITGNIMDKANCIFFISSLLRGRDLYLGDWRCTSAANRVQQP
ncbi:hypothetical protein SBA7_970028 [Candidatus Sulfotelmatobacter sp. SbA7]|nr:hypothetical protein SBA7_970028 [Candidatus Sulfotelmatobacter sp. SbA7]